VIEGLFAWLLLIMLRSSESRHASDRLVSHSWPRSFPVAHVVLAGIVVPLLTLPLILLLLLQLRTVLSVSQEKFLEVISISAIYLAYSGLSVIATYLLFRRRQSSPLLFTVAGGICAVLTAFVAFRADTEIDLILLFFAAGEMEGALAWFVIFGQAVQSETGTHSSSSALLR